MSKLEEELREAIFPGFQPDWTYDQCAKRAAEVAKRYIEKAYDDAYRDAVYSVDKILSEGGVILPHQKRNEWMKENGVL